MRQTLWRDIPLLDVASLTGETQVVRFVGAAAGPGPEVVDVVRPCEQVFADVAQCAVAFDEERHVPVVLQCLASSWPVVCCCHVASDQVMW